MATPVTRIAKHGSAHCCRHCEDAYLSTKSHIEQLTGRRFIVCGECGNKRCPHADHHVFGCTGSNATGQPDRDEFRDSIDKVCATFGIVGEDRETLRSWFDHVPGLEVTVPTQPDAETWQARCAALATSLRAVLRLIDRKAHLFADEQAVLCHAYALVVESEPNAHVERWLADEGRK